MSSRLDGYLPTSGRLQPKSAVERLKTPETDIVGRLNEVQEGIDIRLYGVLDTVRRAVENYPHLRNVFEAICDNRINLHEVIADIRHDPVAEEFAAALDQALADSIYSSVRQAELKPLFIEEQRLIDKTLEQGTSN